MIVSQTNVGISGGISFDGIRDRLLSEGYGLILGFDGGNSTILTKNCTTLTYPANYKDNTMPSGLIFSVPNFSIPGQPKTRDTQIYRTNFIDE